MNKLATLFFSLFLFSAAYSQCPDVTAYTANVEEGLCVFTGKVSISGACEGLRASLIHPSGTELRENIAADGTAEFTNLGVGTYTLTLVDTGTTPPTESAPQTLVITTLAEAFVATPVPGNCTANGAIVISNTCNDLFAVLTFPNGETLTQKIENGGTEFTSLSDGTYKIYLESQVTGEVTAEREISLANLYQNIILQIHSVTAPTCATSNDGVVQYRIISGGVGPFRVSLLDTGGNTVISEERTRNTATEVINGSFQGTNALPLNSGSYQLVIEDLAGNVAGCGATVVNPIVIPQALNTNVLCYEIEKHPDSYFKLDGECKYRLYLRVKPVDTSLRLTVDQNFYSQPGTAVVIVNETLTYDISSSLGVISNNTNVGWAYVTGHVINPGDDVRVIVKGGMNTIDEHFTFTNLAEPKPGFNATPYASVDSNNCGTVQLRFNMNLHNLTSNHPAVDGNGTYSYRHQWYHSPWDNDNKTNGYWFKVEKQNADGTTWTDVSDNVDWTAYNWVNVTATGEGRYRFTYQQAPNQCYQTSLERVITNTFDDNYIQDKILNSYDKLYGAYEGTVGFYKYFVTSGTEFSWPLVSKLERADGQTSVTYQARLPYEEVKTYTINFPMEKTVTGSGQNSAWGDLPPGSYIWTVTDACGRTASTTVNLDTVTHYKEELIVKNECDLVSISFNLNAQTASGVPITAINTTVNSTLHYKNSAGNWVNYSSLSAGYPVIRGSSGTFSNLPPTYEYRVFFNDIRYPRELTSSSVVDGISVIRTTIPNIKPNDIYTRFTNFSAYPTVAPKERIAAAVSASFCDVTNNSSGLVSVAVTNPQVLEYPLYFELWRKKNPADPASTDQLYTPRVSYDENSGATSHVFTGVTNGDYFVRVGHECGYQDYDVHVEVSQYITPSLTSSKTNNICVGDTARLRFTGSETIFDIKWYRIEEDGTATEIGTNVRLMDVTLERTTTYRVVYGVKASLSCASTYTFPPREITLTVRHDTTPPVPNCPSNITVTAERGECSQIVTWTEPTYTDDCPV
ncbi:MAG: HYR domain-containing protein, partial [Capnocytophaga sp.]|nr:HYR domain-containing protein [Capnocytophaga sp.]